MDSQRHQHDGQVPQDWAHSRLYTSLTYVDRTMYYLDKVIAGMRHLLLFYLPIFLAGYAQTIHAYVFWGTWAALLLLLWEPYLSPPFPWVDVDLEEELEEDGNCGNYANTSSEPEFIINDSDADAGQVRRHRLNLASKRPPGSLQPATLPTSTDALGRGPCLLHGNDTDNQADAAAASPPPTPLLQPAATCESHHLNQLLERSQSSYVRRRILKEEQRVLDWKRAVSASIPTKQHFCYRLLHVLLVAPTITVVLGVKWQHEDCLNGRQMAAEIADGDPVPDGVDCATTTDTLLYSSYLLAALLSLHLLLTLASAALFCVFILPALSVSKKWTPHHMMFFICKILGSALNTIVQTLVAGSFVAFMTPKIFWLCMLITCMSYVATDLLYDLGEPPVGELWGPLGCLTGCWARRNRARRLTKRSSSIKHVEISMGGIMSFSSSSNSSSRDDSFSDWPGPAPHLLGPVLSVARQGSAKHNCAAAEDATISVVTVDGHPGHGSGSTSNSNAMASQDSVPFAVYRKPNGLRGFAITSLLACVAAPCVMILVQLVHNPDSLMVSGSSCEGLCAMRYKRLLFALCCMGLIICYYAITVMLIGMGPVVLLFVAGRELCRGE